MASTIVLLTLVVRMREVGALGLPPGWRGEDRTFVAEVDSYESNCIGSDATIASSGARPFLFHSWTVGATLEDRDASWSVIRGGEWGGCMGHP